MAGYRALRHNLSRTQRWDSDHAEAVMMLEALEQSRQWSAYWKLAYLHPN